MLPQHSESLPQRRPAYTQQLFAPVLPSSQLSGTQQSDAAVHASVTVEHMPPSGGGGGGGGGCTSTHAGASPAMPEQSRRRVLRSRPSTQRRRPHCTVQFAVTDGTST